MKLTPEKQKRFMLALVIAIGVVVGLWFFLVQGLTSKRDRDSKEVQYLTEKAQKQTEAIAKEKTSREQAKAYQAFILYFEEQMPKGNVETWLVKEISNLADRFKLQPVNTTIEPVPELSEFKFKDQPYKLVGFHFEFRGEFSEIGRFLEALENELPLAEVDDISITSGSEIAPHVHSVSMRISMVTKT